MQSTIFQSAPYLTLYRQFFGAGKRFYRVRTDGAEAFLMRTGTALHRLEWWGAGIHDIGGARLENEEAVAPLWREIEGAATRNDGALLAQMRASSPLVALAQSSGWKIEDAESCPFLALPESFDEYAKSLGKNMREQIRRYPKRLAKNYACEYSQAKTSAEIDRALDELFALHGKRWRARGQTGVLVLPQRRNFQRALCHALAAQGALRLWTLRCDGNAVASLLCYADNGCVSYFIGGFEPEMMRFSVGTCLFAHAISCSIEEGCTEFDFLRGREEYKYRLGAVDREYKSISWHAPTAHGKLLQKRGEIEAEMLRRLHQKFSAAHAE